MSDKKGGVKMGKLNKAKNIQIAAMNAKGMTIEAIVKASGVDKNTVKESLEQRGRKYIELGVMSDEQIRAYIVNLQGKGKSVAEIGELTGLGTKKVCEFIFNKDGASQEAPTAETLTEAKEEKQEAQSKARSRISDEIKAKVKELIDEGKSDKEIAQELGIGKTSAYRIRKEHAPGRKAGKINEDFDKAVDKMIKQNKQEADVLTGSEEVIRTQNELRQEAGLAPIKVEEGQMCPKWLDDLERGFMGIYGALTPEERRAWDLGELFAIVSHKRGQYI